MEHTELKVLRDQIDAIDDELVRLFIQRMQTVAAVAAYKAQHDVPVLDAGREARILARIGEAAEPLYAEDAKELFSLLFRLSRNAQNRRL